MPDDGLVVGLDVGATKVWAALVAPDGRPVVRGSRTIHSNEGPDSVIASAEEAIRACLGGEHSNAEAIGVGVAGQVDPLTGAVAYAPNLAWRDVPLGKRLHDSFHVPVVVMNDVRAATVGEWRHGAGRGARDLLLVFVGTGVGGGLVAGGRLIEGASNASGEVGHSRLVAGGRPCHCPSRGCLEAYVGGWAIAARAREAIEADSHGGAALLRRAGSLDLVTAVHVGEAAHAGDPLSRLLVDETGVYLGTGVAGLVNAFNPARVVLGGGVIEGLPELIPVVAAAVRSNSQPPAAAAVTVDRTALGHDAIPVGAAEAARHALDRSSPDSWDPAPRAITPPRAFSGM